MKSEDVTDAMVEEFKNHPGGFPRIYFNDAGLKDIIAASVNAYTAVTAGQPKSAKSVFFSYGREEGFTLFDTAEQSKESAKQLILECEDVARSDGEWPDDAETICWGKVIQQATAEPTGIPPRYEEFELRDIG